MTLPAQDLRDLVRGVVAEEWSAVPPILIEAQVLVESGGDPMAVSPAGAAGLLQIMPATARVLGLAEELLFDPEHNLRAGVRYLQEQFERLAEIASYYHRVNCALAAYNGGRGWINHALKLARVACGEPAGLSAGPKSGPWQRWENIAGCLMQAKSPKGKRPDAAQIIAYVAKIRLTAWRLKQGGKDKEHAR